MKKYGVIMAGGGGTRFWPLSRIGRPKQLLNLSGKGLMVNETIDRIGRNISMEDIFIVTNEAQARLMEQETKGRLKKDHILSEPAARNTAACIAYAAMEIITKYEDGIMCIVPSDAFIKDEDEFSNVLESAMSVAEETNQLVTIGIKATFPATGYGYIRSVDSDSPKYKDVVEFVEKPDVETAIRYLENGNYMWNSGMFVWKASTILEKFKLLLPDIYQCLVEIGSAMGTEKETETIQRIYPTIPKISVDYGIMERANDVVVLEGDFGWNDVGSLDMLSLMKESDENGNVLYGEQVNIDTINCISYGTDKLIATIGIKDTIIIQSEDAILVCDKTRAQDVKDVVTKLEQAGKNHYL